MCKNVLDLVKIVTTAIVIDIVEEVPTDREQSKYIVQWCGCSVLQ